MPRLSIVILVLGDLKPLEDTLVSVLENRPDDCQVLVVLNRPYDDPYDLKDEVLFVQAPRGAGLACMANLGLWASRSPIVHLLASGAEVTAGWTQSALAHFENPRVAAVAPLVLEKGSPERVWAAAVQYCASGRIRRLGQGKSPAAAAGPPNGLCGPDSTAGFYRKSAVELVGRFAEELDDELTGVDLAIALSRAGFQCALEPACRVYAPARCICRQGALREGRASERFFWRWAPTSGGASTWARHSLFLAGELLQVPIRPRKALQLTGRLLEGVRAALRRNGRPGPHGTGGAEAQSPAAPHFAAKTDNLGEDPARPMRGDAQRRKGSGRRAVGR